MTDEKKECCSHSCGCGKKFLCILLGAILFLGLGYCLGKVSGPCMMKDPKMCPIMQMQQK